VFGLECFEFGKAYNQYAAMMLLAECVNIKGNQVVLLIEN